METGPCPLSRGFPPPFSKPLLKSPVSALLGGVSKTVPVYAAMFLDAQKPVVLFAGEEADLLEQNVCRLFSTLDHLGALSKGQPFASVRLISECTGTLVVATEEETEDVLRRFSHLGYMLHMDTSEQIPCARHVDRVVHRPMLLGAPVEAQGVPQAYLDGRFLPEEYPEAYQQARAFWSIGRSDKAIRILKERCKVSVNPLDHYHLGCLLIFELKLFSEGMAALREARRLSPAASAPLLALAMAWMMQERPGKALPLLEEIEKRARGKEKKRGERNGEIWLHVAKLYQSNALPKRAYKAALHAVECEPDNLEARALLQKTEEEMHGPLGAKLHRLLRALSSWWKRKP